MGQVGQRKLMSRQLRAVILKFVNSELKEKGEKPTSVGCLICASHCVKTFIHRISPNPHGHSVIPTLQTGNWKLN